MGELNIEKAKMHEGICKELNDLYKRKNADYGNSFSDGYKDYGLTMVIIRLEDKLRRLKNLAKNKAMVKEESIRDCLVDGANYNIMAIMELDNEKR